MKKLFTPIIALLTLVFVSAVLAADYDIDKSHTNIGFKVRHMVIAKVNGNFSDYSGQISFDPNAPEKSSISVTIQVASISTENEKRDAHLKSPDFFDAAKYPTITFVSKSVKKTADKKYVAVGDLTIRGVTKAIELPFEVTGMVKDPWGNERMGIEASTTINRQDFGVSWNKTLDAGGVVVSDDVEIIIEAELIKKK
ncbi:MAG: YceI family protein [Calditrichia bacterium]